MCNFKVFPKRFPKLRPAWRRHRKIWWFGTQFPSHVLVNVLVALPRPLQRLWDAQDGNSVRKSQFNSFEVIPKQPVFFPTIHPFPTLESLSRRLATSLGSDSRKKSSSCQGNSLENCNDAAGATPLFVFRSESSSSMFFPSALLLLLQAPRPRILLQQL